MTRDEALQIAVELLKYHEREADKNTLLVEMGQVYLLAEARQVLEAEIAPPDTLTINVSDSVDLSGIFG